MRRISLRSVATNAYAEYSFINRLPRKMVWATRDDLWNAFITHDQASLTLDDHLYLFDQLCNLPGALDSVMATWMKKSDMVEKIRSKALWLSEHVPDMSDKALSKSFISLQHIGFFAETAKYYIPELIRRADTMPIKYLELSMRGLLYFPDLETGAWEALDASLSRHHKDDGLQYMFSLIHIVNGFSPLESPLASSSLSSLVFNSQQLSDADAVWVARYLLRQKIGPSQIVAPLLEIAASRNLQEVSLLHLVDILAICPEQFPIFRVILRHIAKIDFLSPGRLIECLFALRDRIGDRTLNPDDPEVLCISLNIVSSLKKIIPDFRQNSEKYRALMADLSGFFSFFCGVPGGQQECTRILGELVALKSTFERDVISKILQRVSRDVHSLDEAGKLHVKTLYGEVSDLGEEISIIAALGTKEEYEAAVRRAVKSGATGIALFDFWRNCRGLPELEEAIDLLAESADLEICSAALQVRDAGFEHLRKSFMTTARLRINCDSQFPTNPEFANVDRNNGVFNTIEFSPSLSRFARDLEIASDPERLDELVKTSHLSIEEMLLCFCVTEKKTFPGFLKNMIFTTSPSPAVIYSIAKLSLFNADLSSWVARNLEISRKSQLIGIPIASFWWKSLSLNSPGLARVVNMRYPDLIALL